LGAFVWADGQGLDFASTANNQFSVRAAGGVRLLTGGTGATLDGQSLIAGTVASSQLSGTYSSALNLSNPGNVFFGHGSGLSGINADTICGQSCSNVWNLFGNANTSPGTNFLGTTDNKALELKVNSVRALRIEPHGFSAASLMAGGTGNYVVFDATGSSIG